jgi:hypothetical protein
MSVREEQEIEVCGKHIQHGAMTQGAVAGAGVDQHSGAIGTVQDNGRVCAVDTIAGSCAEEGDAYVCHSTAPVARSWIDANWWFVRELRCTPQSWRHEGDQDFTA